MRKDEMMGTSNSNKKQSKFLGYIGYYPFNTPPPPLFNVPTRESSQSFFYKQLAFYRTKE